MKTPLASGFFIAYVLFTQLIIVYYCFIFSEITIMLEGAKINTHRPDVWHCKLVSGKQ